MLASATSSRPVAFYQSFTGIPMLELNLVRSVTGHE